MNAQRRDATFEEEQLTFGDGDLVVFVSDGIAEAIDASGDEVVEAIAAQVAQAERPTGSRTATTRMRLRRNAQCCGCLHGSVAIGTPQEIERSGSRLGKVRVRALKAHGSSSSSAFGRPHTAGIALALYIYGGQICKLHESLSASLWRS